MAVLSLFDGISGAMEAFNRIKIPVTGYYSSEIDKYAICISRKRFPNIIQLGDILNWRKWQIDFSRIDFIIAGNPCQPWSMVGKELGIDDARGMLMWTMMDILFYIKESNPNVKFLFENVKMKQEFKEYFDWVIGIESILINSSLLSGQNRQRNYWTNIENITQPEDKGILLSQIIGEKLNKATIIGRRLNKNGCREDYNKDIKIIQCLEVRKSNVEKCNCLTTVQKDNVLTSADFGRHPDIYNRNDIYWRYLTPVEYERLQTFPDNFTAYGINDNGEEIKISDSRRCSILGNSFTVDVISHILSFINNRKG